MSHGRWVAERKAWAERREHPKRAKMPRRAGAAGSQGLPTWGGKGGRGGET